MLNIEDDWSEHWKWLEWTLKYTLNPKSPKALIVLLPSNEIWKDQHYINTYANGMSKNKTKMSNQVLVATSYNEFKLLSFSELKLFKPWQKNWF